MTFLVSPGVYTVEFSISTCYPDTMTIGEASLRTRLFYIEWEIEYREKNEYYCKGEYNNNLRKEIAEIKEKLKKYD